MALLALDAQAALLPYALPVFGVGLALFTWVASLVGRPLLMMATFAIFAINCAIDYAAIRWLRSRPERQADGRLRTTIHLVGGVMWAAAVGQVAAFALHSGPLAAPLLMLAVGGAAACLFFTSPLLISLLVVGPVAVAGPLIVLRLDPMHQDLTTIAVSFLALAFALALIVNRILRRQFALAIEREQLAAERIASLRRVEHLAESKSNLIATLSHEIRDGLTGVTHVLAAAAGGGGRAAPSREQMTAALDAARALIDVLNTTHDSETAEAGRLAVSPRLFDIARTAEDLVLAHRPAAQAKGLEIALHVEDEATAAGATLADPARARQILAALIGNAVKYTVRGRIEVRLRRLDRGRLRLEVADTGPGLSHDELRLAFAPFERVERTAAGLPGAGLGLSLARRLAQLMDGVVGAHSAVGVGSCFWFDCPFDPEGRAAAEPGAAEEAALAEPPQGLRVLLADDDALDAVMVRAVLEQLGHQVVQAHDVRRALSLAGVCDFDLVVLDGGLPNQGAAEAMRAIRTGGGGNAEAPIIAMIDGDADEARTCQDAGADAVLRKPMTVASVARAISEAVAARRPGAREAA